LIQVLLPFASAIALSVVAAYYSVIGLAQIFPGSYWPIIIMGSVLEISKLVTVSWLYNNWNDTVRIMRYYFLIAIVLLMLITSMGIFGYLSKAHLDTNVNINANSVQLKTLEAQEKIAKERLNYLLQRAGDPATATKKIDTQIQEVQADLKKLSNEKLPLLSEENILMAEVGPIQYIAELFYTKDDAGFIDKAVRLVILIIIVVFDPLAILLLIASNQTLVRLRNLKSETKEPKPKAKSKKELAKSTAPSVELFMSDIDSEVIKKTDIVEIKPQRPTLEGGTF
jgi:hypothetical protein